MEIVVKATARQTQGTGASRRLRRAERVPGILYGAGKDATTIELDHNDLYHQLKLESFHASILTMDLDGVTEKVLLRDLQMHPFRQIVMHVDFQRVAADRKLHMKVPLHFINQHLSPGVKLAAGLVSHVMNEIQVSCLPADLPEFIEVDMAHLEAGKAIHVSELKAPPGVEFVLHRGEDPPVVSITVPRAAPAEEEVAEAGAAAPSPSDVPAAKQKAKEEPAAKAPAAKAAPAAKEKAKK